MSHLTIIVDDKTVYIDGQPIAIPTLINWAIFDMDPDNPDDDISAIQYNMKDGVGHAEFKPRQTKQVGRPAHRPPDWHFGKDIFEKHFAFVVPIYNAEKARLEKEAEAAEAARLAGAPKAAT